jgi:hypothetical protein
LPQFSWFGAVNIARARELLAVPVSPEPPDTTETPAADQARMLPGPCPCCGGHMFIIETFARGCQGGKTPWISIQGHGYARINVPPNATGISINSFRDDDDRDRPDARTDSTS